MQRYEVHPVGCVMAIFAHPDDAEAAAGGTLALFAQAGARVVLLTVTQGDKGRGESGDRITEGERAATILGIADVETLGYRDGEFDNDLELRKKLTESIRRNKPEVVICPDPTAVFFSHAYVNHRDHRQTGWAVIDVVSSAVGNKKYFSESTPHEVGQLLCAGSLEPNCALDISDVIDKKIESVKSYESQIGEASQAVGQSLKDSARNVGREISADFAEAFRYSSLAGSNDQH